MSLFPAAARARLEAAARERPLKLAAHMERVAHEAERLAMRHEVDPVRAAAGAWGHDLYRHYADGPILAEAERLRLPISDVERGTPILLHGPVAAAVAERELGVDDAEVLQAIYWHTTAHPDLSPIALIVFVADKLEPFKLQRNPALRPIRELADHNPEAAFLALLDFRLHDHLNHGDLIHPATLEARNAALQRLAGQTAP